MIDHDEARLLLADLLVPGLGDPTRSAAVRAHVSVCSRCQAELGALRQIDTRIREAGPMPHPSDELTARVLSLTADRRPAPAPARAPEVRRRRLRDSVALWRVGTAAFAAATVLALALAISRGGSEVSATGRTVALRVAPRWHATGRAQLVSVRGTRAVRVEISGLPAAADGAYYELWLAHSPTDRISLGAVQPDRSGRIEAVVPLPAPGSAYRGVWLTREPNDNDPRWSDDWIVAGRFT
jgi:anti-sigma-K factor RskA